MRIITYESSRLTFLFPFEEIVPLSGTADGKAIVAAIASKYSFARLPDDSVSREEVNKNGLKFETGSFQFAGGPVTILGLSVYNDGLNIDTNTSDSAEAFLDELIALLRTEFGFREFISRPRKHFWSQIVVEFDKPVGKLIKGYAKLAEAIHAGVASHYDIDLPPCAFGRLDFRWDPTHSAISEPAPRFSVERRANVPFERERYFCAASMRTHDHEELLRKLEGSV